MRVLLLSPYAAHSHGVWADQLMAGLPEIDWRVLSLPARHFSWRIRSNALQWYLERALDGIGAPDVVLATSMTDLAAFRGLFHRTLRDAPAVVYFHENQFAYPMAPGVPDSVEPRMVNLYSALAADRVAFNSRYNLESFRAGAEAFLRRMPGRLAAHRLETVLSEAEVIPVPIRESFFAAAGGGQGAGLRLVWNHRWEYDKGPDRLLAAVSFLVEAGIDFRLSLAGQRFERTPRELELLKQRFPEHVEDAGFLDEADYVRFLARGGYVLSTARHDFQGLAVLEAAASGCVPLVPDRLAYPEWFGPEYRYPSRADAGEDGRSLGAGLLAMAGEGETTPPNLDHLRMEALAGRYRRLLSRAG